MKGVKFKALKIFDPGGKIILLFFFNYLKKKTNYSYMVFQIHLLKPLTNYFLNLSYPYNFNNLYIDKISIIFIFNE